MESERTGTIYMIANYDNGNRYIGMTNNFKRRKRQHFNDLRRNKHSNPYLQNAYNLHGESSFFFLVLEFDIPISELPEKEKFWSKLMYPQYNIATPGKAPRLNRKLSEETKIKISNSLKGHNNNLGYRHTAEARAKMSMVQKGHGCSEEQRKKLSLAWKNRVVSSETGKKISAKLKGRKHTPEALINMSKAQKGNTNSIKKPVRQIDPNTNQTIKIWPSGKVAANELGIWPSSIYEVIGGKKHHITAGGYKWEHVE